MMGAEVQLIYFYRVHKEQVNVQLQNPRQLKEPTEEESVLSTACPKALEESENLLPPEIEPPIPRSSKT
jgi:hypothetical protein